MCVISMISDGWGKQFPEKWPHIPANPQFGIPEITRADVNYLIF